MVYKWCVVPQCTNTSIKTPLKLFVSVPTNPKRRNKWLQLAQRDQNSILSHTNVFMCEDHFDMEKDTMNYTKYKMGFSSKLLLTDEAEPSKFNCQEDSKHRSGDIDQKSTITLTIEYEGAERIDDKLCITCLKRKVPLVGLSSCEHADMLNLLEIKFQLNNFICSWCHITVKKIHDFKIQALNSYKLLKNELKNITNNYQHNLEFSRIEVQSTVNSQPIELQIIDNSIINESIKKDTGSETETSSEFEDIDIDYDDEILFVQTKNQPQIIVLDDEITDKIPQISVQNNEKAQNNRKTNKMPSTAQFMVQKNKKIIDIPQTIVNNNEKTNNMLETILQNNKKINDMPQTSVQKNEKTNNMLQTILQNNKKINDMPQTSVQNIKKIIVIPQTIVKNNEKTNNMPQNIEQSNKKTEETAQINKQTQSKKNSEPPAERPLWLLSYENVIKTVTLTEEEMLNDRKLRAANSKYSNLRYKCEKCIIAFNHELPLKHHMEAKHKKVNGAYMCVICESVFSSKESCVAHNARHYTKLECVQCKKRYNDRNTALLHYRKTHGNLDITYDCRKCDFTCQSLLDLKYHRRKMHNDKVHCAECGNMFANKHLLTRHVRYVHQHIRLYACEACDKVYRTASGLRCHVEAAHEKSRRSFYCIPCDVTFKTETGYKKHVSHSRKHSSEINRYICDDCNKKFKTKNQLRVHIEWEHLKYRTHTCSKCTKVFKIKSQLTRHIKFAHENYRPPRNKVCDQCGKAFQSTSCLRTHVRIHTGERPYKCAHCYWTFAHSGALYTHNKLVHKKRKPIAAS